jgi:transcription antitermination factor NusG
MCMTNNDLTHGTKHDDCSLESYGTPFATLADVCAGASVRIIAGPFAFIKATVKEVHGNTGFIVLNGSVFGQRFEQVFHWKDVTKL